jgi:putative transposase
MENPIAQGAHVNRMRLVHEKGQRMYLWRSVNREARSSTVLLQHSRPTRSPQAHAQGAAINTVVPKRVTTDQLRSYGAAFRHLGLGCDHEQARDKTIAPRIHIRSCDGASAR